MFDHISIGVRDVQRAKTFYNAALKPLNLSLLSDSPSTLGYGDGSLGRGNGSVGLWIVATDHPVPADMRSGLHFCLAAESRAAVDAFYKAALGAGGTDNGPAGPRPDYSPDYYAAFIIDPDGYRLEAYCGAHDHAAH